MVQAERKNAGMLIASPSDLKLVRMVHRIGKKITRPTIQATSVTVTLRCVDAARAISVSPTAHSDLSAPHPARLRRATLSPGGRGAARTEPSVAAPLPPGERVPRGARRVRGRMFG